MREEETRLWSAWRDRRDERAFETLVVGRLPLLHDAARRMGLNLHDAEEVVQESLAELARETGPRPGEVGVAAWLVRSVQLKSRVRRRAAGRRRRHERAAPPRSSSAGRPPTSEVHEEVERALARLDEDGRQILLFRFLYDLDYRDIAHVLGISENACRIRVHRAGGRLRALLGERALALLPLLPLPDAPGSAALLATATHGAAGTGTTTAFTGAILMATTTKFLAGALAGAALAAGAFWVAGWQPWTTARGAPPATPARETSDAPRAPSPAPEEPLLAGRRDAQARASALEEENHRLREELTALREQAAAAEGARALVAPDGRFRFGVPPESENFERADWKELAGHVVAMKELMRDLDWEAVSRGDTSNPAFRRMQEHNMPLAVFAISVAGELGGTGPNGAFTHPSVLANLVAAALEAAGLPLDDRQREAVFALGRAWEEEVAREEGRLAAGAPALARTVIEVDAKQRFVRALENVLTPAQRQVVFDPATRDRLLLDLLSPGLVYIMRQHVVGNDREDLAGKAVAALLKTAGADAEDLAPWLWIGGRWLDDLGTLQSASAKDMDSRFPTVDVVQAYARAQVAAVELVLASGRLTEEQAAELRSSQTLVTPLLP